MSLPSVGWQTMPPQPHAYHPVPPRTTLMPSMTSLNMAPPMEAPTQHQPAKPRKVNWPQPVREYVGRAFEEKNAIPGISQKDVTEKLKKVIAYFAERDALDSTDWANHPLPQALLAEERRQQSMHGYSNGQFTPPPPPHAAPISGFSDTSPQYNKKRKSIEGEVEREQAPVSKQSTPPWRKTNQTLTLQDRITYSNGHNDKRQKKNDIAGGHTSKSHQADLEKRKQRFQTGKPAKQSTPPWRNEVEPEMPTGPVVGTNRSLEKRYLRLTAAPKPEDVRPQEVLEQTLELLKQKWRDEADYNYICSQFKSMRQDLTVQHIKNSFTVSVYEIHARIALEKGDLGEYNQCQTQLRELYKQNLGGHPDEFLAYRILYFVYTCNKSDMNGLLAELTSADKIQLPVKHALEVRSALALGNYHRFFRLYLQAPNMGAYIMDKFIERERFHALANISKAYAQGVTLHFLADELAFDSDDDCTEFLSSHNAAHLIEQKTDSKNQTQFRVKVKEGANLFEQLKATAFGRIDIKGQI